MFYGRKFDEPKIINIPDMPEVYLQKAIEKIGLPPIKGSYQSDSDYGAKCMLIGYDDARKKYKKKIKKLKAQLMQQKGDKNV